jgi:hypothetical protein
MNAQPYNFEPRQTVPDSPPFSYAMNCCKCASSLGLCIVVGAICAIGFGCLPRVILRTGMPPMRILPGSNASRPRPNCWLQLTLVSPLNALGSVLSTDGCVFPRVPSQSWRAPTKQPPPLLLERRDTRHALCEERATR